jgi:cell division protein FtsI (penicillin-binding protein 3)
VEHAAQIDAQLAIPMHPAVPRGVRPLGPGNDPGDPRKLEAEHRATRQAEKLARTTAAHTLAIRKKTARENMDE